MLSTNLSASYSHQYMKMKLYLYKKTDLIKTYYPNYTIIMDPSDPNALILPFTLTPDMKITTIDNIDVEIAVIELD